MFSLFEHKNKLIARSIFFGLVCSLRYGVFCGESCVFTIVGRVDEGLEDCFQIVDG